MTDDHDLKMEMEEVASGRLRLDKWLWYARFFKTRSLAAKLCAAGAVRIGGSPSQRRTTPSDPATC